MDLVVFYKNNYTTLSLVVLLITSLVLVFIKIKRALIVILILELSSALMLVILLNLLNNLQHTVLLLLLAFFVREALIALTCLYSALEETGLLSRVYVV